MTMLTYSEYLFVERIWSRNRSFAAANIHAVTRWETEEDAIPI